METKPYELSHEDSLRLNVLMAGGVQAVRIDETGMILYALTERGEAKVALSPNSSNDQYLRRVREFLAGFTLGSPGGYPVFLQRWTRMGQARDQGLDKLLTLGETEAVISVAYSNGLTDELARRAWWALPLADNARRMLERDCVVHGTMGPILADFLIENLPFEQDPHILIDTVRIVLQPGLASQEARLRVWKMAKHHNAYYVGFLERTPDDLPDPLPARDDFARVQQRLADLAVSSPAARLLLRALGSGGQTFLKVVVDVLRHPADQDVVNALLGTLADYFSAVRHPGACAATPEAVVDEVEARLTQETGIVRLAEAAPELQAEIRALLFLSRMDREMARPILSRTTAVGTLMRSKLEPLTGPVFQHIEALRGGSA